MFANNVAYVSSPICTKRRAQGGGGGGGGGKPKNCLKGYVPPNGVVILKLLI